MQHVHVCGRSCVEAYTMAYLEISHLQHLALHVVFTPISLSLVIVQAPAHEIDTLYTVVKKCRYISYRHGQRHTVITVDRVLYCKLMNLKWSVPYNKNMCTTKNDLHIAARVG